MNLIERTQTVREEFVLLNLEEKADLMQQSVDELRKKKEELEEEAVKQRVRDSR